MIIASLLLATTAVAPLPIQEEEELELSSVEELKLIQEAEQTDEELALEFDEEADTEE